MTEKVNTMTNQRMNTAELVLIGVMAALICIAGPITIPLPFTPVPISPSLLAIYLAAFLLGGKKGTISCLVYLLLGLCGLPVFAGGQAGAAVLFGPTGGYLIGYLFTALITGLIIEKYNGKVVPAILGMILGLAITYLFGTVWFCIQSGNGFAAALGMCVIPFLPGDAVKIIAAAILGPVLKESLVRAGVL